MPEVQNYWDLPGVASCSEPRITEFIQPYVEVGQRWNCLCKDKNIYCHLLPGCLLEFSIWIDILTMNVWRVFLLLGMLRSKAKPYPYFSPPQCISVYIVFYGIGELVIHVISNHPCSPHFYMALDCYEIYFHFNHWSSQYSFYGISNNNELI